MLFSAQGRVVRFNENAVRPMSRQATGVRGIKRHSPMRFLMKKVRSEIEDVLEDNTDEALDLNIDKWFL